jgi:hypothetical protein
MRKLVVCLLLMVTTFDIWSQENNQALNLKIDVSSTSGQIDLTKYSLGQGGLSQQPMIDDHLPALRQLHPKSIRFFIQEYFNLYPDHGKYNWKILDKTLDAIVATGARPIPDICFKPAVLFPKLDQNIVVPSNQKEWDELVYQLVKHCKEKKYGIEYWELGNEGDIGEIGGCPYLYTPTNFLPFYKHTSDAILRADPKAKVGGPALSGYTRAIGDSLMAYCARGNAPLDFFSWHNYEDNPANVQKAIRNVKERLAKYPSLKNTETMITEWNMRIFDPNLNPYFQPAFVMEMTRMFWEEGLSLSAYYHIRDYYIDAQEMGTFLSSRNVEFFANMFNTTPYMGLFDNQGRVKPAYFAFLCLSQMKGMKLNVDGVQGDIKAMAVKSGNWINSVFWNFPAAGKQGQAHECTVNFSPIKQGAYRVMRINAESAVNNLETLQFQWIGGGQKEIPVKIKLAPYEIAWIEFRL